MFLGEYNFFLNSFYWVDQIGLFSTTVSPLVFISVLRATRTAVLLLSIKVVSSKYTTKNGLCFSYFVCTSFYVLRLCHILEATNLSIIIAGVKILLFLGTCEKCKLDLAFSLKLLVLHFANVNSLQLLTANWSQTQGNILKSNVFCVCKTFFREHVTYSFCWAV